MESHALTRFLSKVETNPNGCWIWTGAKSHGGYGNFAIDARRAARKYAVAHRLSYEHYIGAIPEGLQLDHLCRRRDCVNPRHLEPVTNAENTRRGSKGRLTTHCVHGHEYTPENTIIRATEGGRRRCRECARLNMKRQNARRKNRGKP